MPGDSFSAASWADAADIRRGIRQHRFVTELISDTLPRRVFDHYIAQDVHYLNGYAVALRACAAQARSVEAGAFWAGAASDTVQIELAVRAEHLAGRSLPERSAACAAYVSFLVDTADAGNAPVLAAAVLPCFWIFSDLGRQWAGSDLVGHRYAGWVDTYRDPRFAAATDRARAIVDDLAEANAMAAAGAPAVRNAMRAAFRTACAYELLLFDDAYAGDSAAAAVVARPGRLNGSASASATANEVRDADSHG